MGKKSAQRKQPESVLQQTVNLLRQGRVNIIKIDESTSPETEDHSIVLSDELHITVPAMDYGGAPVLVREHGNGTFTFYEESDGLVAHAKEELAKLTVRERAELTPFNAVAHDVYRKECMARQQYGACWLTMSEEARADCRAQARAFLRASMPSEFGGMSDEHVERRAAQLLEGSPAFATWVRFEEELKRDRIVNGNPRAFFMPSGQPS